MLHAGARDKIWTYLAAILLAALVACARVAEMRGKVLD